MEERKAGKQASRQQANKEASERARKQALAQADNRHRQLLGADTNNQMPK
jgi:hypothetical protein